MKIFYTMNNIGKVKYTVNTYNGISTHKDGSPFFGIATYKNKKKRDLHIKELKKEGYIETNGFDSAYALLKK